MKLHPHNLKPDRHPSAWRLLAVVCLLGLLVGNLTAGKKIRFSGKTAFQSVRDTERFEERALLIEKEGMELRLQGKDELIVGEVNHMARKRRVLLDAEDDDDEDKDGNPAPMTATRAIEKRMERMTRPSGLSKRSREVLSRDKKKEKEREEGSDPDGDEEGDEPDWLENTRNDALSDDVSLDSDLDRFGKEKPVGPVFGGDNPLANTAFPLSGQDENRRMQTMSFDRERYLEGQSERLEVLGKLLNPEQGRLGVSSAGAVDFSQAGASPVGALQQFGNGRNFGPQGMQGPSPFDSNRGFDLPGMQPGGQVNSSPVGPASSAAPEKADEPRVKFRDQFKLPTRPF